VAEIVAVCADADQTRSFFVAAAGPMAVPFERARRLSFASNFYYARRKEKSCQYGLIGYRCCTAGTSNHFGLQQKDLQMNQQQKVKAALGGLVLSALAGVSVGAQAFQATELAAGYQVAIAPDGAQQQAADPKAATPKEDKAKEGKCGEGKCGGDKKAAASADKAKEGKCGEGKCGEGKCGGDKKAATDKAATEKTKEGKCGGMN